MIRHGIELVALGWLVYNGWRVLASGRNAVEVNASAEAGCPQHFAFHAYMKVREFYLQLSPAHRKYEMSGGELLKDAVIDVWETAGFQFVKHQYRVVDLVENERMGLLSERTQVKVLGLFKSVSRSEVEFRFSPLSRDKALLGLTIRIIFPNRLRHLLARLVFTEAIWRAHARQELRALARKMEERYAAGAA